MTQATAAVSISDLAKRHGVTRQAMHAKLSPHIRAGRLVATKGRGGAVMVDTAEAERVLGAHADAAKVQAAETVRTMRAAEQATPKSSESAYTVALTEKAQAETRLRNLDLATKQGQLLPVSEVQREATRMAQVFLAVIDVVDSFNEVDIATRRKIKTALRAGVVDRLVPIEAEGRAREAAGPREVDLLDMGAGA